MTLVKAVLTTVAIYDLTLLNLPMKVIKKIDSLRRSYLWAGTDMVPAASAKSIWS